MPIHYQHLGLFSDWVAHAEKQRQLYPLAPPGADTQQKVRQALGVTGSPEVPIDIRIENRWQKDGLIGEAISWWVGYGPRTQAYLLRPAQMNGPLPGVLALHDHGGFKYYGKEKIADGPDDPPPVLVNWRQSNYGGRAFANALAKEGFVVLIHDTFLWGSRRFPLETMPEIIQKSASILVEQLESEDENTPRHIAEYNLATVQHEHVISKYCNLLGTSLSGVVSYEDRIAVNYLRSHPEVDAGQIGCVGLSGGGNRAVFLQASHDSIRAAVIVGLMSTYEGLLDHNVSGHTWMFFPFGWACLGDWPDLAACRAPSPLLVQYDLEDDLFTQAGMYAAHERLSGHYRSVGASEAYEGQFFPGPHKFDLEMQTAAFAWLKDHLSR